MNKKQMGKRENSEVVNLNPTLSVITGNVSGISIPIKRQNFQTKKARPNYMLHSRNLLEFQILRFKVSGWKNTYYENMLK